MAITICPYKLVLLAVTVIFAALVAWNQGQPDDRKKHTDEEHEEEEDEIEKTWAEWWETPWFTSVKANHPVAYRTCYTVCVTLLVVFHFEIFTGGFVCRSLFVPSGPNTTVAEMAAVVG
mmetsp:Transcript_5585/g.7866  ORF Transcript_5585/g.7866 Transcript_5585/m.7866 type:complete len:119 (+) Transcript_5585:249-605(+)